MEASNRACFYFVALSIISACVSSMPAPGSVDGGVGIGQPRRDPTRPRSWSGTLRGPRRTSSFDTQLVDLNRNPTYYNYHTLPEQALEGVGAPVWDSRPRRRRSPLDFGVSGGRRFGGVDAGYDDVLRPPRFRDDQPRQPERTRLSDPARTGCIDGGPSCTPRPQRKYFDFYS